MVFCRARNLRLLKLRTIVMAPDIVGWFLMTTMPSEVAIDLIMVEMFRFAN